jgi:aquaglyceroporin related protein
MTNCSAFFDEFLGTALLVLAIFAINDKKNVPIPNGLAPLALFLALLGISACFGMQTGELFYAGDCTSCPLKSKCVGFAINPARDFGPRVLTAMVGYGKEVFTYRKCVNRLYI